MFAILTVNGELVDAGESVESCHVDLNPEQAWPSHTCRSCGEGLTRETAGWVDSNGDSRCPGNDDADHDPEPTPLAWCNSAAILTDEDDDAVTVTLSVGDPRGAFAFTVRRVPDDAHGPAAGRLILHVPQPGDPYPHVALTEVHPGTYLLGSGPVGD
ncbi:hypothetical protein LG943_12680 [Streptomonospora sp. S1-112]|uniref:Uncharacterized protein n=1 Tax=Streptomonospora mangrovi TaxID=2883123 RepID=A0A9X3NNR4_9ACTN|nr:hypothetical protein [Streptomonospora mangrovi]MDA0565164.1 hypothetical protein [Streptomonospora mangrovi]